MENQEYNFEEEVICGHTVTTEIKKLWSIQLDLYKQLERICKKHNLRFYAGGGTLLGAIRHDGFIPWDDDMDFFMPVEDYDRFVSLAANELEYPYYFYKGNALSRIRRSDTTCVTEQEYAIAMPPKNLGIFIDIFPLCNVPDNKLVAKLQGDLFRFLRYGNKGYYLLKRIKHDGKYTFKTNFNKRILVWRIINIFMSHENLDKNIFKLLRLSKNSKRFGLTTFRPNGERFIWNKSDYSEVCMHKFMNTEIQIPVNYDAILKKEFGDYMKFVKGAACHSYAVLDVDHSFTETLKDWYK